MFYKNYCGKKQLINGLAHTIPLAVGKHQFTIEIG